MTAGPTGRRDLGSGFGGGVGMRRLKVVTGVRRNKRRGGVAVSQRRAPTVMGFNEGRNDGQLAKPAAKATTLTPRRGGAVQAGCPCF
ncbi:hypothetical protein CASFOL_008782 [Castilleja foliolosa]|uniref:Uncharacterized protein n=1 Tax=Castilleja foliolosa TaxID=1961234 RepID=A0ABD3E428_9LAMI